MLAEFYYNFIELKNSRLIPKIIAGFVLLFPIVLKWQLGNHAIMFFQILYLICPLLFLIRIHSNFSERGKISLYLNKYLTAFFANLITKLLLSMLVLFILNLEMIFIDVKNDDFKWMLTGLTMVILLETMKYAHRNIFYQKIMALF
ncbi:MAG: hypothetical protein LBS28_04985 [Streptococcaceae bacterium]|jgi:hypothetical protein|nr:hypothetical protein [Streptococcaceae bacterium]